MRQIIRKFFSIGSAEGEVRRRLADLYPKLWRFALTLTGERTRADDLAQATALRALEHAEKYKEGTSLDAWLFTMARRIWLNEKRGEAVRRGEGLVPVEDLDLAAIGVDTETNIFAREVLNKVMALPDQQSATVLLVYVEGYSYREAAEILGVPVGTIMSRLAAARKAIKAASQPERSGLS
ncbi:MAG: RNA polymerase sigma factor [Pseudomonadota bacterium]